MAHTLNKLPTPSSLPSAGFAIATEYLFRRLLSSQTATVPSGSHPQQDIHSDQGSPSTSPQATAPSAGAAKSASPSAASASAGAASVLKPDLFTQHMQHKTEQQLLNIIQHSRDQKLADSQKADDDNDDDAEQQSNVNPVTGERYGPKGPEPTRHGDWEFKGRCTDF